MWPAVAAGATALASYSGSADTNASNQRVARETRNFNAAQAGLDRMFNEREAKKSRDWTVSQTQNVQAYNTEEAFRARDFNRMEANRAREWSEEMSNTSHQREMDDLKRAGLNPILASGAGGAASYGSNAASGSGASSGIPSSSSASGSRASGQAISYENEISPAIANAVSVMRTLAEVRSLNATSNIKERLGPASNIIEDLGRGVENVYKDFKDKGGASYYYDKSAKFLSDTNKEISETSDRISEWIKIKLDSFMKNNARDRKLPTIEIRKR